MHSSIEHSPQLHARLGGILYLAIIILGLFGEAAVRGALVASGDAAATASSISASQLLWRMGIVGDLLMHVFDVPVIVILYLLLRPVSESLALLAALISLVQTAVTAANKLNLVVPLLLQEDVGLKSFSPEQLHDLSYLAIKAHGVGFCIGLIFFGFACLVRGYLIFKSGYLPKALGLLILVAGLCYLTNSFALLLAPSFAASIFPGILAPAFVGELSLCLWLIIKGVNTEQWKQRATLRHARPAST